MRAIVLSTGRETRLLSSTTDEPECLLAADARVPLGRFQANLADLSPLQHHQLAPQLRPVAASATGSDTILCSPAGIAFQR